MAFRGGLKRKAGIDCRNVEIHLRALGLLTPSPDINLTALDAGNKQEKMVEVWKMLNGINY